MSYALRNTLIIAVLLALVLTGGAYWIYARLPGELDALKAGEQERKAYLGQLNSVYGEFEDTRAKLSALEAKWHAQTKTVSTDPSPASLFAHLSRILALDRSALMFDFSFNRQVEQADYGYIVCSLTGAASFRDLYALLWRLENERRLVKIVSLNMREKEMGGEQEGEQAQSMMAFEMTLHAYYSPKEMGAEARRIAQETPNSHVRYNPFKPLVTRAFLSNTEGEVEVDGATVLAMTSDRVLIRDKNGMETSLREGDRVYLGRLTRIVPEKGRALFTLNEGGVVRSVFLNMGFAGKAQEQISPGERESAQPQEEFLGVTVKEVSDEIQIIITNSGPVPCLPFELSDPFRIVLDMESTVHRWEKSRLAVDRGPIIQIRSSQFSRNPLVTRVVIELTTQVSHEITRTNGRIIVKIPKT
ncbi:MAG: AMIN domain-containing protein [Candidatus Latescibacterota bacterium]